MAKHEKTVRFYRMRLPHWEVERGVYFVTIRLAGALPRTQERELQIRIQEMRKCSGQQCAGIESRIFRDMERWLHNASTVDHLAHPEVARMVIDAIEFLQRKKIWEMSAYVLMPNHIHLFFSLESGILKDTLVNFKHWTAREANLLLDLRGKAFWQREWFDHWSRSPGEDEQILEYIQNNPVKAGMVTDFRNWPYGSWGRQ